MTVAGTQGTLLVWFVLGSERARFVADPILAPWWRAEQRRQRCGQGGAGRGSAARKAQPQPDCSKGEGGTQQGSAAPVKGQQSRQLRAAGTPESSLALRHAACLCQRPRPLHFRALHTSQASAAAAGESMRETMGATMRAMKSKSLRWTSQGRSQP